MSLWENNITQRVRYTNLRAKLLPYPFVVIITANSISSLNNIYK